MSLLEKARANRVAAVAFLNQQRQAEIETGEIISLASVRLSRKPKPVFFSRRAGAAPLLKAA
jgi:hypothetical protein